MFKKLLSISLLISTFSCFGQTTYEKVIRGTNQNGIHAKSTFKNAQGELIISGNYASDESHITKLDSLGNPIWTKVYDRSSPNDAYFDDQIYNEEIIQLQDSNYLLTRNVRIWSNNTTQTYLIKFAENGDLIWSKRVHKNNASNTSSSFSIEMHNGKIIHVSSPDGSGILDILRITSSGVVENQLSIDILTSAEPAALVKDSLSAYLIVTAPDRTHIIHIDSMGNVIDAKKVNQFISKDATCKDSAIYIVGLEYNGLSSFAEVHYASDSVFHINPNYGFFQKIKVSNGDLWAVSSDFSMGTFWKVDFENHILEDYYYQANPVDIYTIDSFRVLSIGNGPTFGIKAYGDPQIGVSLISLPANNYCLYGPNVNTNPTSNSTTLTPYTVVTNSSAATLLDTLALSWTNATLVTTIGCVDHLGSLDEYDLDGQISLSPNPTNESVTLQANEFLEANIDLYNYQGQILQSVPFSGLNKTLSVLELTNGLYFVKITLTNGLSTTKKLVVKH